MLLLALFGCMNSFSIYNHWTFTHSSFSCKKQILITTDTLLVTADMNGKVSETFSLLFIIGDLKDKEVSQLLNMVGKFWDKEVRLLCYLWSERFEGWRGQSAIIYGQQIKR